MAQTTSSNRKVLVLPGDGIGPEIMREVLRIVQFFDRRHIASFDISEDLVGGTAYDAHGTPLTEATLQQALASDAVLFGSVGGPKWEKLPFELRPERGTQYQYLGPDERSAFLCIIAHDLTVAVRSIVFDPPVTEIGLDRVKWINESLHQLTSCVNPRKRWSAQDEASLIRGIIESSIEHGFDSWIGRALAVAAGSTIRTGEPAETSDLRDN